MSGGRYPTGLDEEALRAADAPGRFRTVGLTLLSVAMVVWAFSPGIGLWGRLPDRVPIHFGPSGRPDGWAPKSFFSVFGMLVVVAAVLGLMALLSRLSPKWCNFPGKDRMLRLPPHQQEHVVAPIREAVAWTFAGVTVALSLIARQGWAVALGERESVSSVLGFATIPVALIPVLVGTLAARARIRRFEESA